MADLKKIDVTKLEDIRQRGVDDLDYFRDGRSTDFDTVLVSACLMEMVFAINQLIEAVQKHEQFIHEQKQRPSYRKGMKTKGV